MKAMAFFPQVSMGLCLLTEFFGFRNNWLCLSLLQSVCHGDVFYVRLIYFLSQLKWNLESRYIVLMFVEPNMFYNCWKQKKNIEMFIVQWKPLNVITDHSVYMIKVASSVCVFQFFSFQKWSLQAAPTVFKTYKYIWLKTVFFEYFQTPLFSSSHCLSICDWLFVLFISGRRNFRTVGRKEGKDGLVQNFKMLRMPLHSLDQPKCSEKYFQRF